MLISSLILTTALVAQAPAAAPSADAYVGRWNVRITDAEDTFASGGFQIDKKDGGLAGAIVWRWGSFAPVKSVEVKDGVLRIVREDEPGKPEVFEARTRGRRRCEARSATPTARSTTSRASGAARSPPRPRPSGARRSRSSTARRSPAGSCATPRRRWAGPS